MTPSDRAAGMAYRVLLRHGDGTLPVDPLAILRRCRGVKVAEQLEASRQTGRSPFLPRGTEALTIPVPLDTGGMGLMVVYDGAADPARLRFTLAHELGHIALKHTGRGDTEETEADLFASHLLIPRPVLARLAEARPIYAEEAAALFYVSMTAVMLTVKDPPLQLEEELTGRVAALFQEAARLPDPPKQAAMQWRHLRVRGIG